MKYGKDFLEILDRRLEVLRKRYKEQPNLGTMGRIKELLWTRDQFKWMIKHESR